MIVFTYISLYVYLYRKPCTYVYLPLFLTAGGIAYKWVLGVSVHVLRTAVNCVDAFRQMFLAVVFGLGGPYDAGCHVDCLWFPLHVPCCP